MSEIDKSIKKDKKEKKDKKDKKSKKSKKEKKDKKVRQQWGRYGTISTTDMYLKREEFLMWLSEIKKLNVEAITPQDEKKYFEEFVECYNTATFTSKKYYNFKFWFEKEQVKGRTHLTEKEMSTFDDEGEKRKEQIEQKELKKKQKLQREYQHLHEFQNIAQDMQKQKQLQELMRHHNQMGNHEAATKIQKQLAPIHTLDQPKPAAQPLPEYDDYDCDF